MVRQSKDTYDELIACSNGDLFGPGNARLPAPPMLMFDRITHISDSGGAHDKGEIRAELDIKPELWFFDCHFRTDPVMPGCLGLDAMWQLVGFYLGWLGNPGRGRALGAGAVKFTGQVLQDVSLVEYQLDIRRVMTGRLTMALPMRACWRTVNKFTVPKTCGSACSCRSKCNPQNGVEKKQ